MAVLLLAATIGPLLIRRFSALYPRVVLHLDHMETTATALPGLRNRECDLFVGREKGFCETPAVRLELRIRTTRWFVKMHGAWRQLHHHGSIDAPALLADYQRAIFGKPLGATS